MWGMLKKPYFYLHMTAIETLCIVFIFSLINILRIFSSPQFSITTKKNTLKYVYYRILLSFMIIHVEIKKLII
jgi:hypothetical protein